MVALITESPRHSTSDGNESITTLFTSDPSKKILASSSNEKKKDNWKILTIIMIKVWFDYISDIANILSLQA